MIWAADWEIKSLASQLRDCQGREALRKADLNGDQQGIDGNGEVARGASTNLSGTTSEGK